MPRSRPRVAAFITFVIALSGTKMSSAAEIDGTVHAVESVARTMTFDNGDGKNVATSVDKR